MAVMCVVLREKKLFNETTYVLNFHTGDLCEILRVACKVTASSNRTKLHWKSLLRTFDNLSNEPTSDWLCTFRSSATYLQVGQVTEPSATTSSLTSRAIRQSVGRGKRATSESCWPRMACVMKARRPIDDWEYQLVCNAS